MAALAVAGTAAALLFALAQPARARGDPAPLWRLPRSASGSSIYQLARFYRTIGMLLRGGMPLVAALDMRRRAAAPAAARRGSRARRRAIREGRGVSQSMEANGLTTPVALRMLRVGENSGNMGEMMEQHRRVPRRGDGALGRLVHAPVRADPDGDRSAWSSAPS